MQEHVQHSIRSRGLFRRGQSILVAVSGGLDSMVLLHLLHGLSRRHGWRLTVAHFNHQLRGRSSDADERLVRKTAKTLGLPLTVGRGNVRRFAQSHGLSLEMAGRQLRHDFLARAAARRGISSIALAHHADDQLELFFLRLLRGSGVGGLAGMMWRNASPWDAGVELVRPLLDLPKRSLRSYATAMQIRFREDASNALPDMQRNRIRHELLPLLRNKFQAALDKTIFRLMDIAGAEADVVTEAALAWLSHHRPSPERAARRRFPRRTRPTFTRSSSLNTWSSIHFDHLPVAVQRRCLQLQLLDCGVVAEFELVERLRAEPGKPVSIGAASGPHPSDGRAKRSGKRKPIHSELPVAVEKTTPQEPASARRYAVRDSEGRVRLQQLAAVEFRPDSLPVNLGAKAGRAEFRGARFSWRLSSRKLPGGAKPDSAREMFDADRVGSEITLRHWRRGDRFQPIGMKHAVKLQDFFINEKVPRARRHELIVAQTAAGEVFWVEDQRISERFKVTEQTIRRLQWRWQRL